MDTNERSGPQARGVDGIQQMSTTQLRAHEGLRVQIISAPAGEYRITRPQVLDILPPNSAFTREEVRHYMQHASSVPWRSIASIVPMTAG
jgi:hypothetical protein